MYSGVTCSRRFRTSCKHNLEASRRYLTIQAHSRRMCRTNQRLEDFGHALFYRPELCHGTNEANAERVAFHTVGQP